MTVNEFKTELKSLNGGYLFFGEEDYLKKYYFSSAKNTVICDEDYFNHIIINQDNYSADFLMSSIETLPVMGERKFIEITDISFAGMSEYDIGEFITVLEKLPEYEYNVLILLTSSENFDAGTEKKPSDLMKKLSSVLKPVFFDRESPARLAAWVSKHFASELIVANPDAVSLLISRCGRNMSLLSSEIKKLCYYLKASKREKLTEEDVKYISVEAREFGAFDFTNAIIEGRIKDALSMLNEKRQKKIKPEIILSGITKVIGDLYLVKQLFDSGLDTDSVSKKMNMHRYTVELYIKSAKKTDLSHLEKLVEICCDADIKIKSTQLDKYDILDRLMIEATVR